MGVNSMNGIVQIIAGTAIVGVLGVAALPALAQTPNVSPTPVPAYRPAPGPIAGAGLPVLAVVGFGVYWLIRRRSKAE
jgi:drug/metabolite transporter (DMT)-like permease